MEIFAYFIHCYFEASTKNCNCNFSFLDLKNGHKDKCPCHLTKLFVEFFKRENINDVIACLLQIGDKYFEGLDFMRALFTTGKCFGPNEKIDITFKTEYYENFVDKCKAKG